LPQLFWGLRVSKRPTITDLFSWLEPILCIHALGWSLFIVLYDFEPRFNSAANIIAGIASSGAIVLLTILNSRVALWLDYTLRVGVLKRMPVAWLPLLTRIWATTTILRVSIHLLYVVWWILLAWAVLRDLNSLSDVRAVSYAAIAALHFDRFVRALAGARQR
jgi:hypothetical protein